MKKKLKGDTKMKSVVMYIRFANKEQLLENNTEWHKLLKDFQDDISIFKNCYTTKIYVKGGKNY